MARIGLSKSKIISGLQCPKRLYLEVHRPELAEVSDETERMFSNGHLVGEIARSQQPGGKLISYTGPAIPWRKTAIDRYVDDYDSK